MAGRPPKAKTTETKVEEVKATETKTSNDDMLQELMKQMAELKAQVDKKDKENDNLKDLISTLKSSGDTSSDNGKIRSDDEVEVISQFGGELTLYTQGNNAGMQYKLSQYGESCGIPYGDLKDIVRIQPKFTKNLDFYINDEKARKQLKIEHLYKDKLSHEDMMTFFDKPIAEMEECYNKATKGQKNTLVALITSKIRNNESISMDVVQLLSRLSGKALINLYN